MVFSCICSCESMKFQWTAPNSVSQACLLKLSQSQKCVLTCSEMKPIINLYMQSALGGVGKGQTEWVSVLGRSSQDLARRKAEQPKKVKERAKEKEEYRQDVTRFIGSQHITEAITLHYITTCLFYQPLVEPLVQ